MARPSAFSNAATRDDQIAGLTVVDYEKLSQRDSEQSVLLLSACAKAGFCYLDLQSWKNRKYLDNVDTLFDVGKQYFAQPLEVKKRDTNEEISLFNICGQVILSPCSRLK